MTGSSTYNPQVCVGW